MHESGHGILDARDDIRANNSLRTVQHLFIAKVRAKALSLSVYLKLDDISGRWHPAPVLVPFEILGGDRAASGADLGDNIALDVLQSGSEFGSSLGNVHGVVRSMALKAEEASFTGSPIISLGPLSRKLPPRISAQRPTGTHAAPPSSRLRTPQVLLGGFAGGECSLHPHSIARGASFRDDGISTGVDQYRRLLSMMLYRYRIEC